MRTLSCCLVLFASVLGIADEKYGHSAKGSAFDSGMRTKPWKMEGIGHAPFKITTKNPEVQQWYDQGNALLHSFWFEEAERSFRWCLKLEPDNAMAYWGLARCGMNWFSSMGKVGDDPKDRYQLFLKEAVARKHMVTERERLYIEAWAQAFAPGTESPAKELRLSLEKLIAKYPDEIEAKANLAFMNIEGPGRAYTTQLIVDQVLAKNPMHPGAFHASIHNWDYADPTQALHACENYGLAAPEIGHALHMPGHNYTKMGMWHAAAWSMDAATRIELRYMNQRLALPYETWNYPHNRNYLCYIQEQLGMAEASIRGAKDLLNAPTDPGGDNKDLGGYGEGMAALLRAYIKFERWNDILTSGNIPWTLRDGKPDFGQLYAETIALSGLGRVKEAREKFALAKAQFEREVKENKEMEQWLSPRLKTAEGLLLIKEQRSLEGMALLAELAPKDNVMGDPPDAAWPIYRLIGDFYLERKDAGLAIQAYDKALEMEKNDAFTLSGLARAHALNGDKAKAREYAGRLRYVWSAADPGLKWMKEVDALNLDAKPVAVIPGKERAYRPADLDKLGPSNWAPFAAPALDVVDKEGVRVTLDQYKGKNVLLVFYLDEACVHCVEQLSKINAQIKDFESANTVVLAVSSASPAKLKESLKLGEFGIRLCSDKDHENARRFSSYDDFENMELHSTILIDGQGKVRWKRTGGDPFTNVDYLLRELARVNKPALK